MAIAFARVSIHTRTRGHSAVAGAAYRAGVKLVDERTGETHNFDHRHDVVYSSVMLPEGSDPAFLDRAHLWNAVEAAEKRKDAQVAKDIVLALPKELSLSEHIELARQFAWHHFVSEGLVVDIAIHDHGDGNPHAHLYVTLRRLHGDHFDHKKARDLNPAFANKAGSHGFIKEDEVWHQRWREHQNGFFRSHHLDLEVDPHYLISTKHHGRIRNSKEHYLKDNNWFLKLAACELANNHPLALLNQLARDYGVFSERHVRLLVAKHSLSKQQATDLEIAVLDHRDCIRLGPGDDDNIRYTTRANYRLESSLIDWAKALQADGRHIIHPALITRASQEHQLNAEQAQALQHLCDNQGLAALAGRAGTGKSYLMGALKQVYEQAGYNVSGLSLAAKAARNLEQSSGIISHTLAYYRRLIQHNRLELCDRDVLVIDEAGMCSLNDLAEIFRAAKAANAKILLAGDPEQLQPIHGGAPFRAILEHTGFTELNQVQRQANVADCQATQHLAKGNISAALQHYHDTGHVHFNNNKADTQTELIQDWHQSLDSNNPDKQIILAHSNHAVTELNLLARQQLQEHQQLSKDDTLLQNADGDIAISPGERIVLLRNRPKLGISNGDFATVTQCDTQTLTVKLDREPDNSVTIDTKDYKHFAHGYAATVHKAQGSTYERTFVYTGGHHWDRHLSYVALSRHKERTEIYANKNQYRNLEKLGKRLGQDSVRDNVIDWPISYAIRRGLDPDKLVGRWVDRVMKIKGKVQDYWYTVRRQELRALRQQRQIRPHEKRVSRLHEPDKSH